MATLSSLWLMIQRWLDEICLCISLPEQPSEVSKYAGVLIEIVPCEIGNVVRESERSLGDVRHATNNASLHQSCDSSVTDIKILSAGLPVYIPLENKLLIVGKLIKPLSATCCNVSSLYPFGQETPDNSKNLREKNAD